MMSKFLVGEKILDRFESEKRKDRFRIYRIEENPSWIINKEEKTIISNFLCLICIFLFAVFIIIRRNSQFL
jgi:hypothetical protein